MISTVEHRRVLVALLALLALVGAACGGSDPDASADGAAADSAVDEGSDDSDSSADEGSDDSSADSADEDSDDSDDGAADSDPGSSDSGSSGSGDATDSAGPSPEPEPTVGFDGETIRLGYLTDESGSLAILGRPLVVGSQLYWDWVNEELGGVGGRYRVELVVGDTKDDSSTAVQEYQRLKGDVVLFAEILSTPPTQAVLPFLQADGMVGVPGSLAGLWAKELNLLPAGTAYDYEMINLADWFVNESGLGSSSSVACVVYVDDLYGQSTLEALEHAAEQLGFTLAEKQTISRGDQDFTATISALEAKGCEVVYAITVPSEQNGILSEALSQGFEPVWLGALPSFLSVLAAGAPDRYANFHVAQDSPELGDRSVQGMADFLDRFDTYGQGIVNTFHLSGYLQQIPVHALLELAVERGDLSHEGVLAAVAELGEVDMQGLTDDYVYGLPENRVPASASRIFRFDPDNPPNLLSEITQFDSDLIAGYGLIPQ